MFTRKRSQAAAIAYVVLILVLAATRLSSPASGVFQGGDIVYPWNRSDAAHQLTSTLSPWMTFSMPSGFYTADNSSWFLPLLRLCGLTIYDSPAFWQRIEIVSLISLAGASTFALVQKLGYSKIASALAGTAYATGPVVFNYTVIGWNSLLLAYASMPLVGSLLLSANRPTRMRFLLAGVLAGILFSGSSAVPSFLTICLWSLMIQSQRSGIRPRQLLTRYCLVPVGFAFSNLFWVLPRLIYSPLADSNGLSNLHSSAVSKGARSQFWLSSPFNSEFTQFNNSFYEAFPHGIRFLLFLLPLATALHLLKNLAHNSAITRYSIYGGVIAYAASLVDVGRIFGPLSLLVGREPGRIYAVFFFLLIMVFADLAHSFVTKKITGIGAAWDQLACNVRRGVLLTFVILLGLPFWLGRLESETLPDQPALTLRASPVPGEYQAALSQVRRAVGKSDQSLLSIPGASSVRLPDSSNRFEPLFNGVAASAIHFGYPSSWWATDKVSKAQSSYAKSRGRHLTSGSVSQIAQLMKDEGSSVVIVDNLTASSADQSTIQMLETSPLFVELDPTRTSAAPQSVRFRIFKNVDTTWFYGNPIARMATPNSEVVPTSLKWENITFLSSTMNPVGSVTRACFDRSDVRDVDLAFTSAYSKYTEIHLKLSQGAAASCQEAPGRMVKSPISTSFTVDGRLSAHFSSTKPIRWMEVEITFKPAILQERLIVGSLAALAIGGCCGVSRFVYQRIQRRRQNTSS